MDGSFMVFVLLFGAFAVMGKPALEDEGECDIKEDRIECGWIGIDNETCLKRDCCWDNTYPGKFCYLKKGAVPPPGFCPVAPYLRKECGYLGITKEECLNKSCCWDDTVDGAKWCFIKPKKAECSVEEHDRYKCGWPEINEDGCLDKGCCWNDSNPDNAGKFCYFSKGEDLCDFSANRWDCGWLGIDQATCEARDCCWDDSDPNNKWCYFKKEQGIPEGFCSVPPSNREECGYLGITKEECLWNSCCWDDRTPDTKWCFKKQPSTCDVDNRYECGWLGIDKQTCEKRINCCWDDSDPNKKFCYVKGGTRLPYGLCPVAPSERQECGYVGIKRKECYEKSCCWDNTVDGAKWCFKQPDEDMGCYIYHGISGKCKYLCDPGEKKMYGMGVCKGRICCYKGY